MGWREREWTHRNGIREITRYYVIEDRAEVMKRRKYPGSRKMSKNLKESIRTLSRLLNNNFAVGVDYHLVLTYGIDGLNKVAASAKLPIDKAEDDYLMALKMNGQENNSLMYDAVEEDMEKYIRRCRRGCKGKGIPFRYVYVVSDIDGDSLKPKRVHIHMIVNAAAKDVCLSLWRGGNGFSRSIYSRYHGDMTALAMYLLQQVRHEGVKHRYHPSRGLEIPTPTEHAIQRPTEVPKVPDGYKPVTHYEFMPGRLQTMRYCGIKKQ